MTIKTKRTYTNKQAHELLGISETQVKVWRRCGILVDHADGSLDVETTLTNANRSLNPTQGGRPDRGYGGRPSLTPTAPDAGSDSEVMPEILPTDPDEIRALKMAEAREKVRSLRLKNEVLEKSLIPRDMACEIFADGLANVRSALTSWPTRWRHKFVGLQPAEIERTIRAEVESILKELRDALDPDKLDTGR